MKKQFGVLAQVALLFFLFSGCSEGVQQSSSAPGIALDADPASTILEIFRESDRFARTEKLISVLRAIPADQKHAFEAALDGLDVPNRELDRVLVLTAWAKHDAAAATRWAKNRERVAVVKSAMFAESVYIWALEDHESFLSDMEMALYMKGGIEREMMRALIRGWFDSGEPHLERFIRDMPAQSTDRQRAIDTLVRLMIERDGAAATVEWAKALSGDTYYRKTVNSRVAGQVVVIDSKLAVDWCAEICDSPLGEAMPSMIAHAWAATAGEEAMDFITSLPNAVGVRVGARSGYGRFIKTDIDRAAAWIETTTEEQRRGPVMQGPVGMYTNMLSGKGQPLLAIEWLGYLQNEDERESRHIQVMRRWLRKDEPAAEAWMAQSSMSEEAKLKTHQSGMPDKLSRKKLLVE
jgi:hypothetical protein